MTIEQRVAVLEEIFSKLQDYYTSAYSGEEIDAILAGSANAVRYDAVQSLTDGQKTQARGNIGAAPSGGGVMEYATEIAASSASESYDTFCAKLDAVLATMPDGSVKFLRVYPPQYYAYGIDMCALYKSNNNYASVYTIGSYNYGRQGFRMVKRKLYSSDPAGQWDPLEYINPDMKLGVEYRTTERYLGKPVYVKLVDCGLLADGKKVAHGISNMDTCLSVMEVRAGLLMPQIFNHSLNDPWTCYVASVDKTNITLACGSSSAGSNCQVTLKYTKTTD